MKAKTIVESIGQDFFHYDLIIIRGVPGSGKTTLADMISRYLVSENRPAGLEIVCHHFETDFFFMVDGVYRFNPKLLAENHAKCLSGVVKSLRWRPNFGRCITIVANTFTREFEIIKYIEAAKLAGSRVLIIDLYTQYGNVHGVPPEKVNEMSVRFVPIPSMNWFTNLGRDEVFHYQSFGADWSGNSAPSGILSYMIEQVDNNPKTEVTVSGKLIAVYETSIHICDGQSEFNPSVSLPPEKIVELAPHIGKQVNVTIRAG